MKKFIESIHAAMDVGTVIVIGIIFAALMVIAYIIWELDDSLDATGNAATSIQNITTGFDDAVNLILVVITVFLLALAIGALLMLRGRN